MLNHPRSIVVIGGGHAGGAVALALREFGATGSITIIGEETLAPYERPNLSKEMLTGLADAPVHLTAFERWPALGITLRLGTRAVAIDRAEHRVLLEDGATLPYDILVLATGGTARKIPGSDDVAAVTLRTVADALALRKRAAICRSALILGGGLIGLEVAASMRQAGLDVDLVEAGPQLAARSLPVSASDWIAAAHTRAGVRLHLGNPVTSLQRINGTLAAQLADGKCLTSQLLVLGLGISPDTELAAAADLACGDGIFVDDDYRTVSDSLIFAIGDVAARPGIAGGRRARDESWSHARRSAAIAARAILSLPRAPEEAPWFWTNQFNHIVQIAGSVAGPRMITIQRGHRTMLYLDDAKLVGIACLDAPKDFLIAQRAIAARQGVDAMRAADPTIDLRKCLLTHIDPGLGVAS
jgi:3-phenylpropionate/trans-cinnamate dioxygenase ferredoxin reductase component